jgi:enoyl-CoA hydratase/carnithine racemase
LHFDEQAQPETLEVLRAAREENIRIKLFAPDNPELAVAAIQRVVPDDELMTEATAYARMIANGPPLAYTLLRRMMQRSSDMDRATFAEYEWTNQRILVASKDSREGFASFIEKRPPKFTGE